MERYQRLFQLEDNLYVKGSPVIVSAGALTKDTETGNVFVQIKTKNITDKVIKAIIVLFSCYDVTGNIIDEIIKHEYLDLKCNFGVEIGSKTPIYLDNAGIRSFRLKSINVIFSDGSSCETDFSEAVSIPRQESLSEKYDGNQTSQFIRLFGQKSKFIPLKYEDLFLCSCGAVNQSSKCISCGNSIGEMLSVDADELKKDGIYVKATKELKAGKKSNYENAIKLYESIVDWKDSRTKIDECNSKIKDIEIAEGKAEAERKRKAEEAKARNKKIAMIGGPIVAVLIVFLIVLNTVILPYNNYKKALVAADSGNYSEAYSLFNKNPDYKDTKDQIAEAKLKQATALLDEKKYDEAYSLFRQIGKENEIKKSMLNRANVLLKEENYDMAYDLFREIGKTEVINESIYARAIEYLEGQDYENGIYLLEQLDDINSLAVNIYEKATYFENKGDIIAASILFEKIPGYKDSNEKIKQYENTFLKYKFGKTSIGDEIVFGKYEQNGTEKEDIEWIVLAKEEGKMLVISKELLDYQAYNTERTATTWETCSLRKWLNGDFYSAAFSDKEKKIILTTYVKAEKPYEGFLFDTDPGNSTKDKVFLLSYTEAKKYFSDDEDRECSPTSNSRKKARNKIILSLEEHYGWWLRTPGREQSYVAYVDESGNIDWGGTNAHRIDGISWGDRNDGYNPDAGYVRPAMWIDIS